MPQDDQIDGMEDLARLVTIPSVSAHGRSLPEAATAVAALLSEAGFRTSIENGEVAPFVVGEIGEGPMTVIVYNHYDVQPEGDPSLWSSPPFEMVEREGRWYGRGVADDKGEFVSRLVGWRRYRASLDGSLPYRLIWIVDGEEEIGSPSLERFLASRFAGLKADACWWEFGEIDGAGRPVILCGFKGIAALELRASTAASDLHSSHGAVFDNAAWRICRAVASMRDEAGRVTIDGFYDDVVPVSATDQQAAARSPFSIEELAKAVGGDRLLAGLDGDNFYAAMNFEPCLNVNGISGGHQQDGTKTVVPAQAFAKLDFRLVPDQTPAKIAELVKAHLARINMADIEVIVQDAIVKPIRTSTDHWFVRECATIMGRAFGRHAILQPSSPASGTAHPFVEQCGAAVVGVGLTHHGARLHAPDENVIVAQFKMMSDAACSIFAMLADRAATLANESSAPAQSASGA